MKKPKIFLLIFAFLFLFGLLLPALARTDNDQVTVYFFDDRLCPVCRDTKNFLESVKNDYPDLEVIYHSITDTTALRQIADKHGLEDYSIMAPTLFIGENFFQFRDFTGREERMIISAIEGELVEEDCCLVKIPFLNIELDIADWSLTLIAVALGSIDGFNVCSIGALILVLSIVIMLRDRKKIFFYGFLFIITASVIYGVLVFAWGKFFEILVGQLEIMRILVGLAALGGGIYFFRQFYRFFKHGPTCAASGSRLAQKATHHLKESFEKPGKKFYLLASSIVFFAAIITIVELPCSVGIPIAFAGILVEAGVSLSTYIFYIILYIFFYMLIEMVVFVGAVLTKKIWFAGSKTITWITFIGAMVLFYLAFYYLIGF